MSYGYEESAPARAVEELAALNAVDERFRLMAASFGAREMQYPALIAQKALERAEYPQAFPHLLMSACRAVPVANGDGPEWCLSPAVCYHAYAQFTGHVLDRPSVITARGRCFRAEDECAPGIRQLEFEMREVVLMGSPQWIDASAHRARSAVEQTARELGVSGHWEVAEDPFFLPVAAGKAMMQRLLKVKVEYPSPGARGVALASINRHGSFFGERFDITMPDGLPVHTACIAMGLDRWLYQVQRCRAGHCDTRSR